MTDEPFDFTDLVKSFEMTYKSGVTTKQGEGGNLYFHEYQFPTTKIQMTVDPVFVFETIKQERGLIRMTHTGKYWFDKSFEADVTMADLKVGNSNIDATYEGTNIKDLTDYSPLARFLRWILRR